MREEMKKELGEEEEGLEGREENQKVNFLKQKIFIQYINIH